jgi:hypothetical protein
MLEIDLRIDFDFVEPDVELRLQTHHGHLERCPRLRQPDLIPVVFPVLRRHAISGGGTSAASETAEHT